MAGVVWVACQDFLVREACVIFLVGGAEFLLSGAMKCPVVSLKCQWVWCDFDNLYIEAKGYIPVLLENLLGMSCSGTCWPLAGAWFQCMYGGI